MRASRAFVAASLAALGAGLVPLARPHARRCLTARAAGDDEETKQRNVAKRLWDRVRRKGGDGGGSAEEESAGRRGIAGVAGDARG